ncbi:MAG: type II toxin-antitoxin system VapC family toxin [Thermoplasmata archaeon]
MGEEKLILLDTDVIIEVLDKNSGRGKALALRIIESGEEYCTSPLNIHEVLYGIEKCSKDSRLVLQIPALGYSKKDSGLSAVLELSAERKGRTVPGTYAMVASVAINNGCSLYTSDNHFEVFTDDGLKLFG